MEVKGKITVKAGNGKGFKLEGQEKWFNATDTVVSYLAKFNKGDEVVVTYEKKGVAQNVTKIVAAGTETAIVSKFVCEDCGKELKDGTYQKCYMCSKKAPKEIKETPYSQDRQASIQRGNALNAAAAVLAGTQLIADVSDVETVAELTKVVATSLLDWLRQE